MNARDDVLALHARLRAEAAGFQARHAAALDAWRADVSAALGAALEDLRRDAAELTGGDPTSLRLVEQAAEYADWMQWALWDLPALAAALRPEREAFRARVAGCGLVYLAFRVVDDLVDRHYLYRGRRETLLARFTRAQGEGREAESLTVLGALLLVFHGLERLAQAGDAAVLRAALGPARRTLLGAILELSREQRWTPESYARLVQLKNVDYARLLRAALGPGGSDGLRAFLDAHAALAQRLNDVQDQSVDEARGQPNFVSVLRDARGAGDTPAVLEAELGRELVDLGAAWEQLAGDERGAAALLLGGALDEVQRLGLFAEAVPAGPPAASPVGLTWDASAEEWLERHGPDALEAVACGACAAEGAPAWFRQRGFALRRCPACSHVYVSPRVRAGLRAQLLEELDGLDLDPFLDVQRLHAEHLCRLFRRYARGPRLLDVGFGHAFLMHLAAAYGFEVYGVDASAARLREAQAVFGRRLARWDAAGDAPLPWGAFDALALAHVLEHVERPAALLRHARAALNDDGLLYVAVPDAASVQWRLFGRHWDAVSPVVHLHYFTPASLERLLDACGFELLSRVEHPPEPPVFATRATRLFRELGGSESGELALLARVKGGRA
jgi:SAM-dependent methyltransferase